MSRLIVVGAGVAAYWVRRTALAAGHRVTVVADPDLRPGSDAALALLRPTHLPAENRGDLTRSLALWSEITDVVSGALVTRWDRAEARPQADWYSIDPTSAAVTPDVAGHADPLSPAAVLVNGQVVRGDAVVWCDGTGEGRRTHGVTWVHNDPAALSAPLRVHHVAPYKILAAAAYANGCRLGSSSSPHPEVAATSGAKLLDLAVALGWTSPDGWRPLAGTRLLRPATTTYHPDDGWRWSGFHRTGYGVIPARAAELVGKALPR